MNLMVKLHDKNRAPGDIPLNEEQEASDNWFWKAVREANAYARALQDMTPAERFRSERRLAQVLTTL